MRIEPVTLTGRWVRLEPLCEEHREALRSAADDERIWLHTTTSARGDGFDPWFNVTLERRGTEGNLPFAVRLLDNGRLVGSTSYLDPMPQHKRVEIGATWYSPDVWGTQVNPECKLLLMTHAFETLGMNRVAFCTDKHNEHSQAAIAKLGAEREGLLRAHMVVRNGRVRDTVVFGIVAEDWPRVKQALMARLGAFDSIGAKSS